MTTPSLPLFAGWLRVARWALLFALPLVVIGLVAAQLLDADYAVGRQRTHAEAERNASRLGVAASTAVAALADSLRRRLETAAAGDDPVMAARSLLYSNEVSAVLVYRDGSRLFPPDGGWDLTADMAAPAKALEAAADLRRERSRSDGWLTGPGGATFFQCQGDRAQSETCVALDWPRVAGTLRAAFDTAAAATPAWAFEIRDPFDRVVWARSSRQPPPGDIFDASGALHGWRITAAGPGAPSQGTLGRIALAAPIAVAWLALVWALVRRQRDRVAETLARGELTAKLSHDLRTPLANLKLYTDLIARHAHLDAPREKIADYCKVLSAEIDRLDVLAGDTITLGASARRVRLELAVPDDVVRGAVARLGGLLDAAGCRCDVETGADRACRFDRAGFERILVNLIDNARKYAPGTIRVTTLWQEGNLRLSVRDWGQGFALSPVHSEGFGLGLSVVRDLATANGGGVAIVDCRPGSRVDVTMRTSSAGMDLAHDDPHR